MAPLRYLCYGYLRRERYGNRTVRIDPALLEGLIPPDPRAQERRDLKLDVEALVATLPAPKREMLRLRYIAGLSYEEVGQQLGCRKDAVNRDITRSVKLLNERATSK